MVTLFLSRDRPGPLFTALRDRGEIALEYKSCIRLEVTASAPPPNSDWLFFLSPSGVELFSRHFDYEPGKFRLGALWKGTAAAVVRHLGVEPAFTGQSGDSREALAEFVGVMREGETVTVAQGDLGLGRLRGILPADRLREWTFYSNVPDPPEKASDADYLLFTSPSNAEAYLSRHGRKAHQKVVGIGETTRARLMALGHTDALAAAEPSEKGLWEVVGG